jgi:hypothetical protein
VRTSKALHEAAIRHIWSDLPGIEAIVGVFPKDTFRLERDPRHGFMFYVESKKPYYVRATKSHTKNLLLTCP